MTEWWGEDVGKDGWTLEQLDRIRPLPYHRPIFRQSATFTDANQTKRERPNMKRTLMGFFTNVSRFLFAIAAAFVCF